MNLFSSAFVVDGNTSSVALPLTMLAVLGPAMLLNQLFERLKQPGLLGQILAGVLIGPNVLGWVNPNDFLSALGQLGVMFLLFNVGLHVRSRDLVKTGPMAMLVAVLGVVIPFFAGVGLALLWKPRAIEAIFLGASMVATSVGVTAQILTAKGLLDETASRIILGAAVIDDILGLLILAAVSSLAQGKVHVLELALTAVLAFGFTLILVIWGSRAMGRLIPKMNQTMLTGDAPFVAAMVLLFALSALAIYAGVAAIVGAFLAGLALSGSVENRVQDLTQGVTELLLPFFLVGIGLHFDLGTLRSWSSAGFALLLIVVAVLSKFIACGLASFRLGPVNSVRIGVGMIPRGEVGMVVAQIGLSLGVVSQGMYDGVVLMAVATTFIAPPLLAWAYKGSGRLAPTIAV
jgi:Kef-type K+ transport system membrane component KefB